MANQAPIPTPGKRLTDLSTAERDKQISIIQKMDIVQPTQMP